MVEIEADPEDKIPEELLPWQEAWSLIQTNKLTQATDQVKKLLPINEKVKRYTLVLKVLLALGDKI